MRPTSMGAGDRQVRIGGMGWRVAASFVGGGKVGGYGGHGGSGRGWGKAVPMCEY